VILGYKFWFLLKQNIIDVSTVILFITSYFLLQGLLGIRGDIRLSMRGGIGLNKNQTFVLSIIFVAIAVILLIAVLAKF
jgi:hypothetical protein